MGRVCGAVERPLTVAERTFAASSQGWLRRLKPEASKSMARVKRFSPASKSMGLASKGIAQASKDLDGPAGLGLGCGDVEYFVGGHAWLGVVRLGLAEFDLDEVPGGDIDGGEPTQGAIVAAGQKIRRQRFNNLGWGSSLR